MNTKTNYQILTLGGEEYAVVPRGEYEAMLNAVDGNEAYIAAAHRKPEDSNEKIRPVDNTEQTAVNLLPTYKYWRRNIDSTEGAAVKTSPDNKSLPSWYNRYWPRRII